MGIAFKDLFIGEETSFQELSGKILAVDSYNMLYQFITTIRGRDGSFLTDSSGNVTSHLIGLFSRITNFLDKGLNLVFIFDGKPPELKNKELEKRKAIKIEAEKKYREALKKEDFTDMKKFSVRTSRLTKEMVAEAKELISAFGIPVVDAPSEGEAQAAYMVSKGDCFAVLSQDFDSLVHGATKVVRNLSLTGKRKKNSQLRYEAIKPEMISLSDNLNRLGIDNDQLIALSILIGTDYNSGGIKGIGPKNALKLVKEYGKDFSGLFEHVKWTKNFDISWEDVYYVIKNMPTTDDYNLQRNSADVQKIKDILIEKHDFSKERVDSALGKLYKQAEEKKQKSLGDFFG